LWRGKIFRDNTPEGLLIAADQGQRRNTRDFSDDITAESESRKPKEFSNPSGANEIGR